MQATVHDEVVSMEAQNTQDAPELRVADRCDHGDCNAQAFVVTRHGGKDLRHCGHHYSRMADALSEFVVLDNRASINTAASVAAF